MLACTRSCSKEFTNWLQASTGIACFDRFIPSFHLVPPRFMQWKGREKVGLVKFPWHSQNCGSPLQPLSLPPMLRHTSHSPLFVELKSPSLFSLCLPRSLPHFCRPLSHLSIRSFLKMVKLEDRNCMQRSLYGTIIHHQQFCLLFS